MPSETFYCPNCKRQLTKSAQAYVLGEIAQNPNSRFIGLGAPAEHVTCPACGHAIDALRMIGGDFDSEMSRPGMLIGSVCGLAGAVVLSVYGDVTWWIAGAIGLAIAGAIGQLVTRYRSRRDARR